MVRGRRLSAIALAAVAFALGCRNVEALHEGSDASAGADSDTGSDSDTDVDTDVDTDADTDADTDTDTGTGEPGGGDRVEITTSMGTFIIALYSEEMPITVANFLAYVDEGFYDGLIFHRVIEDFVVQGGAYDADLLEAPANDPIALEIADGLSHLPGTVGAVHMTDPDSTTSQFFVNVADNSYLDGDYALFGAVESGYEVVEAISLVETETVGLFDDVPVEPVLIESAVRLDY
jgi:cyclophilin family peptidyl-prolyl cis-trans isomerase